MHFSWAKKRKKESKIATPSTRYEVAYFSVETETIIDVGCQQYIYAAYAYFLWLFGLLL